MSNRRGLTSINNAMTDYTIYITLTVFFFNFFFFSTHKRRIRGGLKHKYFKSIVFFLTLRPSISIPLSHLNPVMARQFYSLLPFFASALPDIPTKRLFYYKSKWWLLRTNYIYRTWRMPESRLDMLVAKFKP